MWEWASLFKLQHAADFIGRPSQLTKHCLNFEKIIIKKKPHDVTHSQATEERVELKFLLTDGAV